MVTQHQITPIIGIMREGACERCKTATWVTPHRLNIVEEIENGKDVWLCKKCSRLLCHPH